MRTAPALLLAACCACGHAQQPAAHFELRKVSAQEIARLSKALPAAVPPAAPAAELLERVRSLVIDRPHQDGKLRALMLRDASAIGDVAVPIVDAMLAEATRAPEETLSGLEVLGAIDTERSSDSLVRRVDIQSVRVPWIRAQAAFQLGKHSSDHVLMPLLAQLKYETDGDTVVWMAATLAKHGNFAGLDGLRVLAAQGATPEVREGAASMLAKLAEDAHFADAEALYLAWNSADVAHKVPRVEPSARLRLEAWKRIAALGEFDLRLVDDARFALSRSAWWVVDPLAAALHEVEPHTRLHVAQCLERMGSRASGACAELVRALDEPGSAPTVCDALGAIGCADALEAVVTRTRAGHAAELRVAAARALGKLGSPAAVAALSELLAKGETPDLRQTAAEALVGLGQGALGARQLVECLTLPGADPDAAESALELWLSKSAEAGNAAAKAVLERWRLAGGNPQETPSPDAVARRHAQRAELLHERLEAIAKDSP